MIRVLAISMQNCGKCEQAKKMLSKYSNVKWKDYTDCGKDFIAEWNVDKTPFFIIMDKDGIYTNSTNSVIEVRKMLDSDN